MVNDKVNPMVIVMVNHLLEGPETKIQAIGVIMLINDERPLG